MILRKYRPEDGAETLKLFYDTVHSVCCKDYRKEQLDAWAEKDRDEEKWNRSLLKNNCLIAEEDGKILGFADMDENGYLDRLYVGKDCQRKGVATALCRALEEMSGKSSFSVHASITARPFFEKMGYKTVKEQTVERKGVKMTNFIMQK